MSKKIQKKSVKVPQVIKELTDAVIESDALRQDAVSMFGELKESTMVPVKNFGGTLVSLQYEQFGNTRTVLLESQGPKQVALIPISAWLGYERDTNLVKEGYIARTDRPISNPNVVDDIEGFLNNSSESEMSERFSQITNPNVLHRVLAVVESQEKTGKYLAAERALRNRIFKLTDVEIVDIQE